MKTKRILFGLLLCIGVFTISCSSDDNEGETLIPLESKWDLVKVGTVVDGVENLTDPPQNASGCRKDYLDLKIDNTATVGDYDSTISACALTETKGIFSRSHNDLTISIGGTTQVSDIMNLTNKELKLKNKTTGVISVYSR